MRPRVSLSRVTYKYLYQDRENRNCEGDIKARNRAEAYMLLRKRGIRPYRVIGDDPRNWKPWAVAIGYAVMMAVIVVLSFLLMAGVSKAPAQSSSVPVQKLTGEEARLFREKAEEAIRQAPEVYRYNVWKGVNARLVERGLKEIDKPEGLVED